MLPKVASAAAFIAPVASPEKMLIHLDQRQTVENVPKKECHCEERSDVAIRTPKI